MYFDFSSKKYLFLGALVVALGTMVSMSVTLLNENVERLVALTHTAARERADLTYWLRFKLPEGGLLAAVAGNNAQGSSTSPSGVARSVPVLLYHGEGSATSTMPVGVFVEQMRALKAAGWRTITLEQFRDFMQGKASVPAKSFLLTFDDGRRDTFYAADPVMRDLGFTGVMFVITGLSLPDNGNAAVNNFYLSKSELAYMAASGRWELESHGDQDHRGYDVPTATSTAADLSMLSSQHFLSNRFWLPEEGRLETVAEYAARIDGDLAHSQSLLVRDFGAPVIGYAYPFNDFGENTVNFPGATPRIAAAVEAHYTYAFYQTWPGNGDTFNYPDPNAYLVKRFEPSAAWSGEQLLAVLESGETKALPYTVTSFTDGWQANWGTIDPGTTLGLSAPHETTGAAAFLDGTEAWKNYRISATAQIGVGTLSLIARHTNTDAPYLVCAYSEDHIYLERHSGDTQTTLARKSYAPPAGPRTVAMSVDGSTATCSAYGVVVSASVPAIAQAGGVGASVWDPEAGTARATITQFLVRPL